MRKIKNNLEEKTYRISVEMGEGEFTKTNTTADLPSKKTQYTAGVAAKNKLVEALDRYDDFSQLQLPPKSYEKRSKKDAYGILYDAETHEDKEVILPHQRKAAQRFLKELRGFGLLADIVGSGKTYEACVVLSELAARGKINSMLLIVPEQVYTKWVYVLEMQFGLGKGTLYQADAQLCDRSVKDGKRASFASNLDDLTENAESGFTIAKRPIIVSTEDFVKWPEKICDVLFDAVVVDEAHHLCAEEGEYSHAMYRLSKLMQVKKKANKTYCVLCSATPHSGDIEHMFRLWYFIRCNGGNPEDFKEKNDEERTQTYRSEKEFYKTRVCHNASTVMEFIKRVKVEKTERDHKAELRAFIQNQASGNSPDTAIYRLYLSELDGGVSRLTDNEKFGMLEEFLEENYKIDKEVSDYVANEYHNGVLRSIMIRQANRVGKKRYVVNVMFAPVTSVPEKIGLKLPSRPQDTASLTVAKLNDDDGVLDSYGKKVSLLEYAKSLTPDKSFSSQMSIYSDLIFNSEYGILPRMGMTDDLLGKEPTSDMSHEDAITYYWDQTEELGANEGVQMHFVPVKPDLKILNAKIEELKNIIHSWDKDKRIIVFYDYDLRNNDTVYKAVYEALRSDPYISDRVLEGVEANKDEAVKKFTETPGTVLLVEDGAFTEGVDLQESNIIVNFQITPDPVAMDQRIGRIFRLGQTNDIYIYSLADMRSLEGYVLMYFSRIGLMSSNSGDATIIAGCNNDRSVTVRCSACGRARMYDEEEYKRKDQEDSEDLYCRSTTTCRVPQKGTRMEIIGTHDFKCDSCGALVSRSEEGYLCMSKFATGRKRLMCNGGEKNDRKMFCHKICAISHCRQFLRGDLAGKCAALKTYENNPNATEAALLIACEECKHRSLCPSKCRLANKDVSGADLIKPCTKCDESGCKPHPHTLSFDDNWECRCPKCEKGTLKPIRAHTFAEYVRSLWNYKFDRKEFSTRLGKEANKVSNIRRILDKDDE